MKGKVTTMNWIGVEQLRSSPKTLFVFGDNMAGWGKGGQAIIRDEPNAVGIPTKRKPATTSDSYFCDEDFANEKVKAKIDEAFLRLKNHLESGGDVIFPADGVGTGLAQLPQRAPIIFEYICSKVRELL